MTSIRGTPYIKLGGTEGGNAGKPQGYTGTVGAQYGRDIIDTRGQGGTPYQSNNGNPATARRVVSADLYGKVMSNQQGNANDPSNTGSGVILDSVASDYEDPTIQPAMDSPVPGNAPLYQTSDIVSVNQARLGSNMSPAHAKDDLLALGGVMSRGMEGVDKSGDAEDSLTRDDTLPGVAPRR
jgi:hypothetical protein